jgi:hypothetical protein
MKQTLIREIKKKRIIKKEWRQMKETKGNIIKHNVFKNRLRKEEIK